MHILIIGNGGREHALGWALKQDARVKKLFFAPGNAGTLVLGENLPIQATDLDGLAQWAQDFQPDLTVVGPEAPLCAGVVDQFEKLDLKIFGPNRSAARLEGSKVFTKEILIKAGIPTARSRRFDKPERAREYSRKLPFPQVFKADGLASGKGVIIAQNETEADSAIETIMEERAFGDAGREILVEEFLEGQEMSVHAVTDGRTYRLFPSAQDHKRIFDNDQGPNTGGMGAYAPSPLFTPEMETRICKEVFDPLLAALRAEEVSYQGVLYAGLMMTPEGPKVLEFNCRFGDPETQVLLPLLETPLLDILLAVVEQKLKTTKVKIKPSHALTVVLASPGYPENPATGHEILGLNGAGANGMIFHAGTKQEGGKVLTSGGRVLSVTGEGATLREACDRAYATVGQIRFDGVQFRRDIGAKALNLIKNS